MRISALIFCALILSGCYTERRAVQDVQRARATFPGLFREVITTDTVWSMQVVNLPGFEIDSTFWRDWQTSDTFEVKDSTGKVQTVVTYYKVDTLTKFRVVTKVKRDTATVAVPEIQTVIETEIKAVKYIPKWIYFLIGGLVMFSLVVGFSKR